MALTVAHDPAVTALRGAVDAFLRTTRSLPEVALLEPSRCLGWTRFDVVDHVLAGWSELFAGLADRTDGPPTVDAASYWTAYAEQESGADPVLVVMAQRRHALAHSRPSAAVTALDAVGAQLDRVVANLPEGHHAFQGHVLTSGDLLTTWAVETVIHQHDVEAGDDLPEAALDLAHRTAEHVPDLAGRLPTGT
ncbi:maleylpyruvate isomerase N-terminal domain-containing protein [Phycicoccus avicenniae]|uniref:maleylpyruvate isomerase N-terminal domain-containing protein n=1 Tax=Phycicoccus avicenniae TaxID=2828860 RepID=UPI003D28CF86